MPIKASCYWTYHCRIRVCNNSILSICKPTNSTIYRWFLRNSLQMMLIITPLSWKEVSHPSPLHSIIWPVLFLKLIHPRSVNLMAKIMIYFGRMILIPFIFRIKRRHLDKSTVHTPQISNMENQLMAQMIWIIQQIWISKRCWRPFYCHSWSPTILETFFVAALRL